MDTCLGTPQLWVLNFDFCNSLHMEGGVSILQLESLDGQMPRHILCGWCRMWVSDLINCHPEKNLDCQILACQVSSSSAAF